MSGVGRVLACVVVVIILHVLKSLFIDIPMGWKHGGGAIPMAIFVGVCVWCVIKTWKGLGKKENKPTEQPINHHKIFSIFHQNRLSNVLNVEGIFSSRAHIAIIVSLLYLEILLMTVSNLPKIQKKTLTRL